MRLYAGSSRQFIEDTVRNQIAGMLKNAFWTNYRYEPSLGEVQSWQNSLRAISDVFRAADLMEHGVILEYELPLSSLRLDCLVCGRDTHRDRAVVIELKQWSQCTPAAGENEVVTWLGGAQREVLHPSVQVERYRTYLADVHTVFHQGPEAVALDSCAYLHNYYPSSDDILLDAKFDRALAKAPLFSADGFADLTSFLRERLSEGAGLDVLARIEESRYRPSRKLMDHVADVIAKESEYTLLDEQLVVYDRVLALVKGGAHRRRKTAVIVKGGPGTGKSVIAMNLLGDLLRQGVNAQYATGSKAFTETLRKIVGTRGEAQFKYFMSYDRAQPDEVDVLICDESHRIREKTVIPKRRRSEMSQIDELLRAARVCVFFIDDLQVVRPNEIGSVSYIRKSAEEFGCETLEYELEAQFRCAGSDGFVSWIDNTLGLRRTATTLWEESNPTFDFRIFSCPEELDDAIKARAVEGFSARMTAGFCWPWSDPDPKTRGLVDDVVVGNYRRPWNAKSSAGPLARGIPKESLWATDSRGVGQVGCIYTAQGFEFDYVGVIVGPDLSYDFDARMWKGNRDRSFDSAVKRARDADFAELIRRTYRVLLTRGMKGCYVYFADKDAERFFRSRMEA